jgi:hypothetical protein
MHSGVDLSTPGSTWNRAAGHLDQFKAGPTKRRPTQVVEAQFAQPFLVATALVHGKVGIAEVDGLGDTSVLALAPATLR